MRSAPTLPSLWVVNQVSRGDCKGIGYRLAIDFRMRSHSTQRCFSGWPVLRAAVWSAKLAPDLIAFGTSSGDAIGRPDSLRVRGRPGFNFSRFHAVVKQWGQRGGLSLIGVQQWPHWSQTQPFRVIVPIHIYMMQWWCYVNTILQYYCKLVLDNGAARL